MLSEEILKVVFPCLEAKDLTRCMLVCKLWRETAEDDYNWKCLCAKRWPSVCRKSELLNMSYLQLYRMLCKRKRSKKFLPPRLSFTDLDFCIDIWCEEKLVYSEVVPGTLLQTRTSAFPVGMPDVVKFHLSSSDYKMTIPMQPRFNIPLGQTVCVSVLVVRRDSRKVACIINRSLFEYIDRSTFRAMAFDYLDFSPAHPFVSGVRAWISLLFMDHGDDGAADVFGIELDFCDAANTEDQVLWLLDMLDWQ